MVRPLPHLTLLCIAIVFLLVIVGPVSAAVPKVTSVSPTSGWTSGGTTVTITGTGFVKVKYVSFGGTRNATGAMTVDSDTQITVSSPPHYAGTVDVTVTNQSGTSSTWNVDDHFTYLTPVPTVTGINPTSGPTTGGTSVVITGTGFVKVKYVSFGGTRNATGAMTVDSDTQITVTSPPHYAGTVDVKVYNNSGSSATSSADRFTYMNLPSVYSVTPNSGPSSGFTFVVIKGDRFTGVTGVKFGDTLSSSFTFVNDHNVTALSPPGSGMVDVRVITPAGISPVVQNVCPDGFFTMGNNIDESSQSCECYNDTFTYIGTPTPAPVVTGISPTSGSVVGGDTVTITGSGFLGTTAVQFESEYATLLTVTDSEITVSSPAHALGTVDVTVTTAGGTSATSPADQFTYVGPTVTGISPTYGSPGGGTSVTITGSGLLGTTEVKFGDAYATILTVSGNTITVTSPGHPLGTVDVTVTNPGGTSATSPADQYTFVGVPVVTGVSPSTGSIAGGDTVTITGSELMGASDVQFGTVHATILTVSADTITVTAPGHVLGTVDVTVTTLGGTSATSSADEYTYAGATVTGVSPAYGSMAGGDTVTISGSGFLGASDVQFGSAHATINSVSDTTIVVISPGNTAGTYHVTVTTPAGTSVATPADQYMYIGVPTITGISPTSGSTAGNTPVTITGNGFLGTFAVKFGTTYGTIQTVSDTTITVLSPGHTAGIVDITATTVSGTSATSSADQFTYS